MMPLTRLHGVLGVVVVVAAEMVVLVNAPVINNYTSPDERLGTSVETCLIREFVVPSPSEVAVLAHISESSSAVLVLIYPGVDDSLVRDTVTYNNTMALHWKVREGKSTKIPQSLVRQIPEGWNTFMLLVANGTLTVRLVHNEKNYLNLYTLSLMDNVTKMHVEGNVSHCHRVSPEWDVKVGEEVTVLLQPEYRYFDQWLKVNTTGAVSAYVSSPTSRNSKTSIPNNTILRISVNMLGTEALLTLFTSQQDGDEELMSMNVPVTLPLAMVVGCKGGGGDENAGIHLRLMLTAQSTVDIDMKNVSTDIKHAGSAYVEMVLGGFLVGAIIVLVMIVMIVDVKNLTTWPYIRNLKERCSEKKKILHDENYSDEKDTTIVPLLEQGNNTSTNVVSPEQRNQLKTLGITVVTDRPNEWTKEVIVSFSRDVEMKEVLDMLKKYPAIEVIVAKVPELSLLSVNSTQLLPLPDVSKVHLVVGRFNMDDLDRVSAMITALQPQNGYSSVTLSGSQMKTESWQELLDLMKEVTVKGKVILPCDNISGTSELNTKFNIDFTNAL